MGSSVDWWVRKLSVVCLPNNAIVAGGILVTILHCGTPEPRLSAFYTVSLVGTSLTNILDLSNCIPFRITLDLRVYYDSAGHTSLLFLSYICTSAHKQKSLVVLHLH